MTTTSEDNEVLDIFKSCNALLHGHFILRSGLHSEWFFQCAQLGQHMDKISRLAELLITKIGPLAFDTVLAPAMGGLVMGQEIARQTGKRFIFVEKEEGKLVLRRGFTITPGERLLVIEDVITRGGRVREALDIILENEGIPVAVGVIADRSEGKAVFEVPCRSLATFAFPTYDPQNLPAHLKTIPAVKPGSK
jgi:orotate phosphoribosyltransferase